MEPVQLAAILAGAVLVASMVSVEVGISVALIELGLGIALGNVFDLNPNASWLAFIASFASVVLTFLAGAEVDPDDFQERFVASVTIGVVPRERAPASASRDDPYRVNAVTGPPRLQKALTGSAGLPTGVPTLRESLADIVVTDLVRRRACRPWRATPRPRSGASQPPRALESLP